MSYCVYLKHRQPLPAEPVARLISEISGLAFADGQQIVRRCRGFLMEHLEPDAANRLVRGLREINIDAECRQMRDLVANPRPVIVHGGTFRQEACIVQDWKSVDSCLAWEDVFLLSVAQLKELDLPEPLRKRVHKPAPSLGIETGAEEVKKEKAVIFLDFYLSEPRSHYRIQSTEFRYDYLGEKLMPSSVANFVAMLHGFDKYASSAQRDEGFAAALRSDWEKVPAYTAIYEMDEYHRWLLQTFSTELRKK